MKRFNTIASKNIFLQEENIGNLEKSNSEYAIVNVYDDVKFQKILGFGAALTEAAAYNYSLLSDSQKKEFLERYFSDKNGLSYNVCRLHINSCDFSLDIYNNVQSGDETLDSFSIERDKSYIKLLTI